MPRNGKLWVTSEERCTLLTAQVRKVRVAYLCNLVMQSLIS